MVGTRPLARGRLRRDESLGHESGRRIAKVMGHAEQDRAQRPSGDVEDSQWRASLMNWSHDPLKS